MTQVTEDKDLIESLNPDSFHLLTHQTLFVDEEFHMSRIYFVTCFILVLIRTVFIFFECIISNLNSLDMYTQQCLLQQKTRDVVLKLGSKNYRYWSSMGHVSFSLATSDAEIRGNMQWVYIEHTTSSKSSLYQTVKCSKPFY